MMYRLLFSFLLLISCLSTRAQELQANVEVMHTRIQGVDAKVFSGLKIALQEFLNNRKWSNDNFAPNEKIQCNFFLNITEMVGSIDDNLYKASLTVSATRPIFNTSYTSSTFNFMDREIAFRFESSQVIQFEDNRVSGTEAMTANLAAVFAYYAYMILGYDYDTFAPNGGESFFKKAQNVVMNAPEDARLITGWKSSERKTNRYFLVDQILNPRYQDVRMCYYEYHRNGLDRMRSEPEVGLKTILSYFDKLKTVNSENPSSIYLMSFFTAKSPELINILEQLPMEKRKSAAQTLAEMDVSNAAKYKSVK